MFVSQSIYEQHWVENSVAATVLFIALQVAMHNSFVVFTLSTSVGSTRPKALSLNVDTNEGGLNDRKCNSHITSDIDPRAWEICRDGSYPSLAAATHRWRRSREVGARKVEDCERIRTPTAFPNQR